MANLSEANGTVYIKASNLKTIEYFLHNFKRKAINILLPDSNCWK